MPSKKEAPLSTLQSFLPPATFSYVMQYLQHYKVHLTITRERKTVLGDYRFAVNGLNHRISINGNLNPYAFLITLLHELAHLVAFIKFGRNIAAHGGEWQQTYSEILGEFLAINAFPQDIAAEVKLTMRRPAAGSCAEDGLLRVLRKYDEGNDTKQLVEDIPENQLFITDDGRMFQRGKQLRKRIRCTEIKTGRIYLFSPVYEVKEFKQSGPM